MIYILKDSLEEIGALNYYYRSLLPTIRKGLNEAHEKYALGAKASVCLRSMAVGEDFAEDEEYLKMRESISEYVDFIKETNEEGKALVRCQIKKREELIEKGVELDFGKAFRLLQKDIDRLLIHRSNTLIMLITKFEEFVARLFEEIFEKFPDKYLDGKQISYAEIKNCSCDEVKDKIVAREIDAVMRMNFSAWFEMLEKHHMSFEACKTEINFLREMYYRRNIVVHNAGYVNEIYLKGVPEAKFAVGEKVILEDEYLKRAFRNIKIIVFSIMIESVRLQKKERRNDYLYTIFRFAYEELDAKEYELSRNIFMQLLNNKESNAEVKVMSQVNCWIAEIEMGNFEKVKKEISEYDVSALDTVYYLAKEVLLGNYESAIRIIGELFPQNITIDELEHWPLFMHLRSTEQYENFKSKHAEEFEKVGLAEDDNPYIEDGRMGRVMEER